MRIIKEGKTEECEHVCIECKCVFAFAKKDMTCNGLIFSRKLTYMVKCPFCNSINEVASTHEGLLENDFTRTQTINKFFK